MSWREVLRTPRRRHERTASDGYRELSFAEIDDEEAGPKNVQTFEIESIPEVLTPPTVSPFALAEQQLNRQGTQDPFPVPEACNPGVSRTATREDTEKEDCDWSIGWVLFVCGFVCIAPWVLGALLPCCSDNRNDRLAAYFSSTAFVVISVVCVVLVVSYS